MKWKNLLIFAASCGHVDIDEITDAEWEKHTAPVTLVGSIDILGNYKNPTRIGRKTRAVYIYPERYCCCLKCMREIDEDMMTISKEVLESEG